MCLSQAGHSMFLLITSFNFRPFRDSKEGQYCDTSHMRRRDSFTSVQGMWRQQTRGRSGDAKPDWGVGGRPRKSKESSWGIHGIEDPRSESTLYPWEAGDVRDQVRRETHRQENQPDGPSS